MHLNLKKIKEKENEKHEMINSQNYATLINYLNVNKIKAQTQENEELINENNENKSKLENKHKELENEYNHLADEYDKLVEEFNKLKHKYDESADCFNKERKLNLQMNEDLKELTHNNSTMKATIWCLKMYNKKKEEENRNRHRHRPRERKNILEKRTAQRPCERMLVIFMWQVQERCVFFSCVD